MILTRNLPDGLPCKLPTGYSVAQTAKSAGSISVSITYLCTKHAEGPKMAKSAGCRHPFASLRVNFPSAIFSAATIGMASSLAQTRKLAGSHWFFEARTNSQLASPRSLSPKSSKYFLHLSLHCRHFHKNVISISSLLSSLSATRATFLKKRAIVGFLGKHLCLKQQKKKNAKLSSPGPHIARAHI